MRGKVPYSSFLLLSFFLLLLALLPFLHSSSSSSTSPPPLPPPHLSFFLPSVGDECDSRCYTPHNLSVSVKTAGALLVQGKTDPIVIFETSFGITLIDADYSGSSTFPAVQVSSPYFADTKITLSTVTQQIEFSQTFVLANYIVNLVDQSKVSIAVKYTDPSMGTITRLARKATTGVISLFDSVSTVKIGNPLYLMVADWDANLDAGSAETVAVLVSSNVETSSPESVTLLENDLDSGVFTGVLNTTQGTQAKQDQVEFWSVKVKAKC